MEHTATEEPLLTDYIQVGQDVIWGGGRELVAGQHAMKQFVESTRSAYPDMLIEALDYAPADMEQGGRCTSATHQTVTPACNVQRTAMELAHSMQPDWMNAWVLCTVGKLWRRSRRSVIACAGLRMDAQGFGSHRRLACRVYCRWQGQATFLGPGTYHGQKPTSHASVFTGVSIFSFADHKHITRVVRLAQRR